MPRPMAHPADKKMKPSREDNFSLLFSGLAFLTIKPLSSIEDKNLQKIEDWDQIRYLLNLLNSAQREVIILHCGEQFSFREISQILGIPARTVQSRVRAALMILRKEKR